jgi:Ulp1 family protease
MKELKVQRQTNGTDCGVFAVAFLLEFCFRGVDELQRTTFDVKKMRQHMASCLEQRELTPFPQVSTRLGRKKVAMVGSRDIELI